MLELMSAAELASWKAYADIEPIGEDRADLRAGIICSTVSNANRGGRGRPAKPNDFMPVQKARRQAFMDVQDADTQVLETFASTVQRSGRKLRRKK